MKELVLSAGHHLNDSGATKGKLKENELAMMFRDRLAQAFRSKGYRVDTPNDSMTLRQTIKYAQAFPGAPAIEIHFNAFNSKAKGVEAFYNPKSQIGKKLATHLVKASEVFGFKNRGIKTPSKSARGRLGFISSLHTGVILEVCFMDNPEDYRLIDEPHEVRRWVNTIVERLDKHWDSIVDSGDDID